MHHENISQLFQLYIVKFSDLWLIFFPRSVPVNRLPPEDALAFKRDRGSAREVQARRRHEYTKRYFEDLHNPESARQKAMQKELQARKDEIKVNVDAIYNRWEDTEDTTKMWEIINSEDVEDNWKIYYHWDREEICFMFRFFRVNEHDWLWFRLEYF